MSLCNATMPVRTLADELREEMAQQSVRHFTKAKRIRSGKDPRVDGDGGIQFQICGGGVRVLRKRLGND